TSDAGTSDAGTSDGGTTSGLAGTAFTLVDGSVVTGQVVADYDHSLWWDASDQTSWAVFDPDGYAIYPDGRSTRFVTSLDIASQEPVDLGTTTPYVDFLRAHSMVIGQMPIPGPAYVIMGNEGYHLEEDGYGNYAWDLVQTDDSGVRYTGLGVANEDFLVWGARVISPVSGVVVEIVRNAPDNTPGSYPADAVNNMLGIGLGGHFYLYLYHFQQNSIPASLHVGDVVSPGTLLGLVGNAGVTLEPHLHLTAYYYDVDPVSPSLVARSWSVPMEWSGLWQSKSPTGPGDFSDYLTPSTGTWIDDTAF
ncbi:MAG: M23 family metallopeptidase, partial [Oligoflexia bacterium]|nr:M23 family metallopeptidase [Oligoflexia bacterium]